MTQLHALQTFTGPDGDHQRGDFFEANDARVDFLVSGGYAELAENEPATPEPKKRSKEQP